MDKKVIVYSSPTCPWCLRLKQFLGENNVIFQDIDVSGNQQAAEEMIRKTGQMAVPAIDIEGEIIVGFDREKIKSALGL
ncbi:MAG: NrdH-redoxin [Candidatus Omnitrophica bacterium]|nr:NrdH-redoxin [Candidatus Omnitrophota bacterium]